ncbi:MAG: hypothetical protein ACR2OL_09185 [Anderseniella sp.]
MKKTVRPISLLTALAFSGLALLAPISPGSATKTSNVAINEHLQGNQFEVPEEYAAQQGRYYIANRIEVGTSDQCHYLSRKCTLLHGYGNGIFWQCMKRGGCG